MKENKRFAIFLGHPAHFHLFKNVIKELQQKGYIVDILLKRKDILEQLVQNAGLKYIIVREKERVSSTKWNLIKALLITLYKSTAYLLKYRPRLIAGTFGSAVTAMTGVPNIACSEDDADIAPLFCKNTYPFASAILTPVKCRGGKWDKKIIKYESYHELAYLHPNHFTPDSAIVNKYFQMKKPFFLLRFAKLNAHHDRHVHGINTEIAQHLIDLLSPHGDIYITSERPLEPQFEKYRIHINPLDIHHVLAFASIYIGDSQTMAMESGILGVPFVRFSDFAGRIGVFQELEDFFQLGFSMKTNEVDILYSTVETLLKMTDRKEIFQQRREKMLAQKIDHAKFLTWFLEEYPESKKIMKKNPDYQYNFK